MVTQDLMFNASRVFGEGSEQCWECARRILRGSGPRRFGTGWFRGVCGKKRQGKILRGSSVCVALLARRRSFGQQDHSRLCGTACSPAVLRATRSLIGGRRASSGTPVFFLCNIPVFFPCNAPVFFLCNATWRARPEQQMQPNVNGDNQLGLASVDPGRLRSIAKRCKPLQNHFKFCNRLQWPTGG